MDDWRRVLNGGQTMSPLMLVLIVLVIILLFGGGYGYRSGWHSSPYYGPGFGIVGLLIVVLLVLLLMGRL
jgi:competence protein ComGC